MLKKSLFFLVLSFFAIAAIAQFPTKVLEDSYSLPAGKAVDLNLKFAREIKVNTWNRNELGIKTILTLSDASLQKYYTSEVREGSDALHIETGYAFDEKMKNNKNFECWNCNDEDGRPGCICLEVSYELMLPADARLTLETISGDIEIRGLNGPIRAKSISGFVDVALSARNQSSLRFRSVTGEIYSDFDVELDKNSTSYSKRLTTSINGGGAEISLETVSGDIFFRKM